MPVSDGLRAVHTEIEDGTWIDLSHGIDEGTVGLPFLPKPVVEPEPEPTMRATRLTMATHVGTHVEAPYHLFDDGRTIDEYEAGTWIGRGVVCEVAAGRLDAITRADLAHVADAVEPRDAVLFRTGWDERAGEEAYYEPPYLDEAVAEWLVDRGVAWVGVDSPSPEMPAPLRGEDFDFPVHRTLFENDVAIAENVTNLGPLADEVIDVVALPLSITGREAAPARIVARVR